MQDIENIVSSQERGAPALTVFNLKETQDKQASNHSREENLSEV
jgi:hypothetical protein